MGVVFVENHVAYKGGRLTTEHVASGGPASDRSPGDLVRSFYLAAHTGKVTLVSEKCSWVCSFKMF